MKKLILVLGLLLIGTVVFASDSNFKPGSEPDGFRGIKWGTDIRTLPDMELLTILPNNAGEVYQKKNDELKIGGATLKSVLYNSWRGKFSGVVIYTRGLANWVRLKEALFEKFGEGYQDDEGYIWFGKITNVVIDKTEGTLLMYSAEISNQKTEYNKQKAKEGAEKGF